MRVGGEMVASPLVGWRSHVMASLRGLEMAASSGGLLSWLFGRPLVAMVAALLGLVGQQGVYWWVFSANKSCGAQIQSWRSRLHRDGLPFVDMPTKVSRCGSGKLPIESSVL